jgi:hypothetical protein
MRVLVTGARDWDDPDIVGTVLSGAALHTADLAEMFVVIEGGAKGADECARNWAPDHPSVSHITERAEWEAFGKRAGPIRNRKMVDEHEPDVVFAFHNDLESSKGTKDCVTYARSKGIPVYLVSKL